MIQLIIVADDFTGALDSGVHFSERGINTRVVVVMDNNNIESYLASEETTVLVVDAETRHISRDEAYAKVFSIVSQSVEAGVPYIFKKTDSALRGNIGAELEATLEASGNKSLIFVPAFPEINRTTVNGEHFIDGFPVTESVFGIDPFEPVTENSVKKIIELQSNIPVFEKTSAADYSSAEGISVFDAETSQNIADIADTALKNSETVFAGCAGFASTLSDMLEFESHEPEAIELEKKLFVLCGSVNMITRKQLRYARDLGYPKFKLDPVEKLDKEYFESDEHGTIIEKILEANKNYDCVMLDSNDKLGKETTIEYAEKHGITLEGVRSGISQTLGLILKDVLEGGLDAVILVTGGDTLLGFMKEVNLYELHPIQEIRTGCVLTTLQYGGREYHIITKSGGFGEEDLIVTLTKQLGR